MTGSSRQRGIAGVRLAIDADEVAGGHLVALESHPAELVGRIEAYRIAGSTPSEGSAREMSM
jgi:hypothetical protein